MELMRNGDLLVEHFEKSEEYGVLLTKEGRDIFLKALSSRILEIHNYIELDKKRYTFLYAADQQIKSLIRAYEQKDATCYQTRYTDEV